ncbi:MAG TPA: protein DA1 [Roseiflexaceae bacterium]|nr:protein DA1 [Roseiflexaceae bacterium]
MISPATAPGPPAADRLHCAACGALLAEGYFYIQGRPERYCHACMSTRPRCDICSAPVGNRHWLLHDARRLCARCHTTAIYDPAEAERLFRQTVGAIIAQLGLALRVGVEFRLVDAPTIAQVRASGEGSHPPEERTLGLYQRQGMARAIYMLYGLPRLLFRTVVAHEYAHAWQGESCPLLEDDALREGFAEWVAYRHLLYLGCTRAAAQLRTSNHPYRPLLEQVLALEAQVGPAGVIEHLRTAS